MASAYAHPNARPALDLRIQQQLSVHWQNHSLKTIEKLENEARRLLRLEQELALFAQDLHQAAGQLALLLAERDAERGEPSDVTPVPDAEEVAVFQAQQHARAEEVKTRYRYLARAIDQLGMSEGLSGRGALTEALNTAYRQRDIAAMLHLEAQLEVNKHQLDFGDTAALECTLRDITRASETYAKAYRELLHSPLNELMLRALVARQEGWDFVAAVKHQLEDALAN